MSSDSIGPTRDRNIQSFLDPQTRSDPGSELAAEEVLIDRREYVQAEKGIRSFLLKHPNSPDGHFLLGYILYREDRPDSSLAEYTHGAHFRKPDANDLAVVAMDYALLNDYKDADKWLTRATEWKPSNAVYWYYLGRTKYVENRYLEAIDVFTKCLTLQPRDVRAEYNLGLAYEGVGRYNDAVAAYRTAIAWQQDVAHPDPQPYLDLGMLLAKQGQESQAVSHLRKAMALGPENPRAHEVLGQVEEQLNQLTNAQRELQTAVSLAPNVSSLHFELGRLYQKEGKKAEAKREFALCTLLYGTQSTDSAETPNINPHR